MSLDDSFKDKEILIVDDNPLDSKLLEYFLQNLGFKRINLRDNLKGVLKCIVQKNPKIIFFDSEINKDFGYVFCDRFKNYLADKIIFPMSNKETYKKRWEDLGFPNFIDKKSLLGNQNKIKLYIQKSLVG